MLLVIFLTIAIGLVYYFNQYRMKYWERHGFKQLNPRFLIGDAFPLMTLTCSMAEYYQAIYTNYKKHKLVGVYILQYPLLVVTDPKVLVERVSNKLLKYLYRVLRF